METPTPISTPLELEGPFSGEIGVTKEGLRVFSMSLLQTFFSKWKKSVVQKSRRSTSLLYWVPMLVHMRFGFPAHQNIFILFKFCFKVWGDLKVGNATFSTWAWMERVFVGFVWRTETMHQLLCFKSKFSNHFAFILGHHVFLISLVRLI